MSAIDRQPTYSLCGELGSQFMMKEWGYPPIGVYFANCPSAGHDMLCLDYRTLRDGGEPTVVHVDQENDYQIKFVAPNFKAFVRGLRSSDAFPFED
ncbi:MAG: SMI1/KNR4 family protein [Paracoccaceae bacterium]